MEGILGLFGTETGPTSIQQQHGPDRRRFPSPIGYVESLYVIKADHTGAFGSGAGFAMQDGWLLAQIIQHFQKTAADVEELLARSLELFDSIRSPYYAKMYDYLDGPNTNIYGKGTTLSADPAGDLYWVYGLDIRAQWEEIEKALLVA